MLTNKATSAFKVFRTNVKNIYLRANIFKENSTPSLNFAATKDKSKNTYLETVKIYTDRNFVHRRGHVEFIYSALKHMEEFGVNKDLNVYKALIDVMPKGKFIPSNIFQAEFMHYPKQQQCIVDVLEQMEDNGVMPDVELGQMLLNIFGNRGFPVRKYWRMMYWMPKFKYLSPWYIPNPLPEDTLDLAKLAIERISSVDVQTTIEVYYYPESDSYNANTMWIVSSQSPTQKKLIENHNRSNPIYVEGPYKVWLRSRSVDYFVLKANPEATTPASEKNNIDLDDVSNLEIKLNYNSESPTESVHQQEDGTIMALCATQTSNKDSLLSWIRHLQKNGNPTLEFTPIVFCLKSSLCENLYIPSS